MLLPWYHPVCLLFVSEEKPLHRVRSLPNLCSAGEKDHSIHSSRATWELSTPPTCLHVLEHRILSWEGRSRCGSEVAFPSDLAPVIGSLLAAFLVLFRSTRVRLYMVVDINNSTRWTKCQLDL